MSRSSFFNYFTSKDEAVYGYTEPHVPTEALERMGPSGDPVAQATELLLATMRTSTPEGTPALRKQLIQTNPALGRFRLQALARSEDLVIGMRRNHQPALACSLLDRHRPRAQQRATPMGVAGCHHHGSSPQRSASIHAAAARSRA